VPVKDDREWLQRTFFFPKQTEKKNKVMSSSPKLVGICSKLVPNYYGFFDIGAFAVYGLAVDSRPNEVHFEYLIYKEKQ
jgi:hypothetical protein